MSTFSPLKIELIGTGEQDGTWGTTTNVNLGTAIEEAITGTVDVAFSSADVTLTLTDTNGSQTARNLRLNLTGTSGGARNLYVPTIEKFYIINNGLADAVTEQLFQQVLQGLFLITPQMLLTHLLIFQVQLFQVQLLQVQLLQVQRLLQAVVRVLVVLFQDYIP